MCLHWDNYNKIDYHLVVFLEATKKKPCLVSCVNNEIETENWSVTQRKLIAVPNKFIENQIDEPIKQSTAIQNINT